jgi:hypothetical protein
MQRAWNNFQLKGTAYVESFKAWIEVVTTLKKFPGLQTSDGPTKICSVTAVVL